MYTLHHIKLFSEYLMIYQTFIIGLFPISWAKNILYATENTYPEYDSNSIALGGYHFDLVAFNSQINRMKLTYGIAHSHKFWVITIQQLGYPLRMSWKMIWCEGEKMKRTEKLSNWVFGCICWILIKQYSIQEFDCKAKINKSYACFQLAIQKKESIWNCNGTRKISSGRTSKKKLSKHYSIYHVKSKFMWFFFSSHLDEILRAFVTAFSLHVGMVQSWKSCHCVEYCYFADW